MKRLRCIAYFASTKEPENTLSCFELLTNVSLRTRAVKSTITNQQDVDYYPHIRTQSSLWHETEKPGFCLAKQVDVNERDRSQYKRSDERYIERRLV